MQNRILSKYCIVGSVSTILLLFVSAYLALNFGANFNDYTLWVIIATFTMMLIEFRSNMEEVPFKFAFRNTFLLGFAVVILSSIGYYFLIKFYNRNVLIMLKMHVENALKSEDFPVKLTLQDQIMFKGIGPLYFTMFFMIFYIIKVAVWATLTSIFFKKNKVAEADEQYN